MDKELVSVALSRVKGPKKGEIERTPEGHRIVRKRFWRDSVEEQILQNLFPNDTKHKESEPVAF